MSLHGGRLSIQVAQTPQCSGSDSCWESQNNRPTRPSVMAVFITTAHVVVGLKDKAHELGGDVVML